MLGVQLGTGDYLSRLRQELEHVDQDAMCRWSDQVMRAWRGDRFVFVIGNGGSGLTASHIAEDLGKGTIRDEDFHNDARRRLKVLSLTDNLGWILALGNDLSYEQIFLQQLKNFASPGDLLIAISGSGNSPNVLQAVEWANVNGLVTFGLTGFDGGKLKELQQDGLHVDLTDMGMVESIHLCLHHWVMDDVYARMNAEGRHATDVPGN
jgi:D-sedoheptulose 7-phosphate isomerase